MKSAIEILKAQRIFKQCMSGVRAKAYSQSHWRKIMKQRFRVDTSPARR